MPFSLQSTPGPHASIFHQHPGLKHLCGPGAQAEQGPPQFTLESELPSTSLVSTSPGPPRSSLRADHHLGVNSLLLKLSCLQEALPLPMELRHHPPRRKAATWRRVPLPGCCCPNPVQTRGQAVENNRWGNKGFFLSSGLRGPFTAVRVRIHRAGTGGRSLPRNVHFHSPSRDTGNSNPGVGLSGGGGDRGVSWELERNLPRAGTRKAM